MRSLILMFMRRATALALTLVAWALVACSAVDPSPHPDVKAEDAAVHLVDDEHANFFLFASNQSYDDETVHLTITLDGATVVDGDFRVEGQHNWFEFPLDVAPGHHDLIAEYDSGATLEKSFRVPAGEKRFAVIDHWGGGDSAELTWSFQREPVAFG